MNQPHNATPVSREPLGREDREKEREQRRRRILDTARKLFLDNGFEATTMAQIAGQAGIAVGTVYKLFDDKDAIYHELIDEVVAQYEREMLAALNESPDDPRAQIERHIAVGSDLFVRTQRFARLYFSETRAAFLFTTANLETIDSAFARYRRITQRLEEVFQHGIAKGVFVNIPAKTLALGLEGVHNAFLGALVRDPDSYTPEQITAFTKRMFLEPVLA